MEATSVGDVAERALPAWHVAVLEDDASLRDQVIVPGLAQFGFKATGLGSAAELYRSMLAHAFDMIVLDLGLPDEDGVSVARYLRQFSAIGILVLTGRERQHDQVHSLDAGADVFLRKPAGVAELAASLHSLGRRLQAPLPGTTVDNETHSHGQGDWRLQTGGWHLVSPGGVVVSLSPSERCVMQLLVDARGAVVTRKDIIFALRQDSYDFDPHRLEMLIYRLRRKVRELALPVLPLVTVRSSGYAFVIGHPAASVP